MCRPAGPGPGPAGPADPGVGALPPARHAGGGGPGPAFQASRPSGGSRGRLRRGPRRADPLPVSRREVPVSGATTALPAEEVARLEALRRLAMGAAHALNNAMTAAMGEASLLGEERKEDRLVAEASASMLGELERCARITRALLTRRHPSQGGRRDVDLVRTLRELGNVLAETLGRQHDLQVAYPDDLLPVRADAPSLELLLLALVHYAADHSGGSAEIRLSAQPDAERRYAEVRLEVTAPTLPEYASAAVVDPSRAPDAVTRLSLESVARVAAALDAPRHAAATGPDAWAALVRIPLAD